MYVRIQRITYLRRSTKFPFIFDPSARGKVILHI